MDPPITSSRQPTTKKRGRIASSSARIAKLKTQVKSLLKEVATLPPMNQVIEKEAIDTGQEGVSGYKSSIDFQRDFAYVVSDFRKTKQYEQEMVSQGKKEFGERLRHIALQLLKHGVDLPLLRVLILFSRRHLPCM